MPQKQLSQKAQRALAREAKVALQQQRDADYNSLLGALLPAKGDTGEQASRKKQQRMDLRARMVAGEDLE